MSAYLFVTDSKVKSLECKRVELHQFPKQIKTALKNFLRLKFFTCDVINKVLQIQKNNNNYY